MPIAHPELVDYDPDAWAKVEAEGLGGFTGVTPLRPIQVSVPPSPSAPPTPAAMPQHDSAGRAKFIGQFADANSGLLDVLMQSV